jgi:hypothetical protein
MHVGMVNATAASPTVLNMKPVEQPSPPVHVLAAPFSNSAISSAKQSVIGLQFPNVGQHAPSWLAENALKVEPGSHEKGESDLVSYISTRAFLLYIHVPKALVYPINAGSVVCCFPDPCVFVGADEEVARGYSSLA